MLDPSADPIEMHLYDPFTDSTTRRTVRVSGPTAERARDLDRLITEHAEACARNAATLRDQAVGVHLLSAVACEDLVGEKGCADATACRWDTAASRCRARLDPRGPDAAELRRGDDPAAGVRRGVMDHLATLAPALETALDEAAAQLGRFPAVVEGTLGERRAFDALPNPRSEGERLDRDIQRRAVYTREQLMLNAVEALERTWESLIDLRDGASPELRAAVARLGTPSSQHPLHRAAVLGAAIRTALNDYERRTRGWAPLTIPFGDRARQWFARRIWGAARQDAPKKSKHRPLKKSQRRRRRYQ